MTDSLDLLLPERTRLVHIGMPKSGSTAVQEAARGAREALLGHGVLYPGEDANHHRAASWLTGTPINFLPKPGPHEGWWKPIRQEIDDAGDKRVLFSYEAICWTDVAGARNVVESMDGPTHGLLVLRNMGSFAPSVWQQNVKSGRRAPLHRFLEKVFESPDPAAALSPAFHRTDGYMLPQRWAEVLGPENLTVVVLEKSQPDRLLGTIERMLGLPDRLLLDVPVPGAGANRGLSTAEAALIVHLNRRLLNEWRASKRDHRRLVFDGAVPRLVHARVPGPDEERIGMPRWALEAAAEIGHDVAEAVRASGARVVGDLDELSRIGTPVEEEPSELPVSIPSDIALEALAGMFAAATGWDHSHTHQRGTAPAAGPAQGPAGASPAPVATQSPAPTRAPDHTSALPPRLLQAITRRLTRR